MNSENSHLATPVSPDMQGEQNNALTRLAERHEQPLLKREKLQFAVGSLATYGLVEGYMSLDQASQRVALLDVALIGGMVAAAHRWRNRSTAKQPDETELTYRNLFSDD